MEDEVEIASQQSHLSHYCEVSGTGKTAETQATEETPTSLKSFEAPEKTIDASRKYEAVITTDEGDIVVALSPDAPQAANSLAFLAGQNFYDGLQFFWVYPEFDAQAGDPTCPTSGEFSCSGAGG